MGFLGSGKKEEILVDDVYENPQRTQSQLRKKNLTAPGSLYERDVTMPPELMNLLKIKEGDDVIIHSKENIKGASAIAITAPEELCLGPTKADTAHCFITMSASLRDELKLKPIGKRDTSKFKTKYSPVYVRRK